MPNALAFSRLVRGFGAGPVLDGVSGHAEAGDLILVRGANGSGKSTLLRCLAGLLRPQRGEISCREAGRSLDDRERRLRVGYVAPGLAFYEPLTARENMDFFCRLRRCPLSRGERLLNRLGVPPDRPAGALSSGQEQRLRWSWALLHQPRILLLDEPFQNLDDEGRALVADLLQQHLEDGGLAVVASPSSIELPAVALRIDLS